MAKQKRIFRRVFIKLQFTALHCWPECPIEEVSYLRNLHRHAFHVMIRFKVGHDDRDIEFINAKNEIHKWIQENWEGEDLGRLSCEQMATKLSIKFSHLDPCYVCVSEDDENGAEIWVINEK